MNAAFDVLQITRRQQSRDQEAEITEEWRTMAVILDRLLFWLTLIVLVAFAIWLSVVSLKQPHLEPGTVFVSLENQQSEHATQSPR